MLTLPATQSIELWPIDKLIFYARNPRKNDSAVDRMSGSIREFGFKIPVLARSDGEVVDGHLRLKAARKLGITEVPVILCDEWTPAQVKAFRLMVNRSVTWASWDEELLALELQELKESDFDLDLTGFDTGEIDSLLALEDDEKANATPPLPETPVSRPGDCGCWSGTGCFAGMRVRRDEPACWCVQRRLAYSVGSSPTRVKVRTPVAWIVRRKETESRKPIDKAIEGW